MTRPMTQILHILLIILSFSQTARAQGNRHHFLILYGFQDGLNTPHNSHTFITLAETSGSPFTRDLTALGSQTLSWLPVSADVRLLRLTPEAGRNYSLPETLRLAASRNLNIKRWGPIEVSEQFYFAAMNRIALLQSGAIGYVAEDSAYRNSVYLGQGGGAINCMHAVSDIGGFLRTNIMHGFAASQKIFEHLSQWRLPSPDNNEWVAAGLGIQYLERADAGVRR